MSGTAGEVPLPLSPLSLPQPPALADGAGAIRAGAESAGSSSSLPVPPNGALQAAITQPRGSPVPALQMAEVIEGVGVENKPPLTVSYSSGRSAASGSRDGRTPSITWPRDEDSDEDEYADCSPGDEPNAVLKRMNTLGPFRSNRSTASSGSGSLRLSLSGMLGTDSQQSPPNLDLSASMDHALHPELHKLVLKFTTMSEGTELPSFVVGREGATIGRSPQNTISIPNDSCMQESEHAVIEWRGEEGSFFIQDRGHLYGAAIRIGMNATLRDWPLSNGATFSAGNSVFRASEVDKTPGIMLLEVLAGPLKGETYCVSKEGATLGRATDNTINIADRELSRRHSKIEWVPSQKEPNGVVVSGGGFYLTDIGSTNGTYVQLVGPYSSSRRLRLSDHILVGRTGFSVNRYDWGIWEDRGVRKTMEDKSIVIQDMCVRALSEVGLFPQTFFAVYDGHGGAEASSFLWQNLHVNLSEAFEQAAQQLKAAHDLEMSQASAGDTGDPMMMCSSSPPAESVDDVIRRVVSKCFLDSDKHFLATSERPQCGSTATTVLIAGDRFYSFNVGDSRTILCRRSQNHLISADHKPSREDELQRIRDAGGLVINKRVMGELAVSRAFGDKEFKLGIKAILCEESGSNAVSGDVAGDPNLVSGGNDPSSFPERPDDWNCPGDQPLITAEPEIICSTISEDDDFVLLASDGLWDVYSNEEVLDMVKHEMTSHRDAQRTCEVLTERAISERYTRDNVSVVLVKFQ